MNQKIINKVLEHHNLIKNKIEKDGGTILMTTLIGSQNYHLDNNNSDYDTYSFILPNFLSFVRNDAPISYELNTNDGKCMVKDMRLALNLLRKSNPNSVECFVGQYRVYNAAYKEVFDTFFHDDLLFFIAHCNYKHMFDAICGTIKGMEGRNMSYGKKASHILRLASLFNRYQNNELLTSQYLKMDARAQNKALMMKINDVKKEEYEIWKDEVYNKLKKESENFDYSSVKHIEETGLSITDKFQLALMNVYLQEYGYEKQSS